MTPEERKTQVDVIAGLDLSSLPDEALLFLGRYLTGPAASSKVGHLLDEATRLHSHALRGVECYEHVGYRSATFLFAHPNGLGGQRVVSNIAQDQLDAYVGAEARYWAVSARIGEHYHVEGMYVLVRTA